MFSHQIVRIYLDPPKTKTKKVYLLFLLAKGNDAINVFSIIDVTSDKDFLFII